MYFGLAFAFSVIGLTAGYLVAASETPVVSAALPVLAGLASAAIAVVAGRADLERIGTYVKDVAKQAKERDPATEVATLTRLGRLAEDHTRTTVRALGLLTTLFAVGFAGGLGAGTWVRVGGHVNAWAHPVPGPWTVPNGAEPRTMVASFEGALYWLGLEQQLRRSGVPKATIAELYDQYLKEVDEVGAAPRTGPDPGPSPDAAVHRVSPTAAAHQVVAAGTFASVAPIATGGIPNPAPAVHMEALLEAALQEIGALRRDGASLDARAADLALSVDRIHLELDTLPRAPEFEAQFETLRRQFDAPLCWTLNTLGPIAPSGPFGTEPGVVVLPPIGSPQDVEPRLPGLPLYDPAWGADVVSGRWGPCVP